MGWTCPGTSNTFNYVGGLLHGDLGMSYRFQGRSVNDILANGIWVSISLGAWPWPLSVLIGVPIGIIAALRQNGWVDRSSMILMLALFSIPTFVMIPILRAFNYFVLYRNGLPSLPPAGWGTPAHWVMPVIVLAAVDDGLPGAADAVEHARDAAPGLHPHGAGQGAAPDAASSACTPCATRCCRSSP